MLRPGQKIVYYRKQKRVGGNFQYFTGVTPELYGQFLNELKLYLRHIQPFVKVREVLCIPWPDLKSIFSTTAIIRKEIKGNSIEVGTPNSSYRIDYEGIDLERILREERRKEWENEGENNVLPFPTN